MASKHNTKYYIPTTPGPPVYSKPWRLALDKLKLAMKEFLYRSIEFLLLFPIPLVATQQSPLNDLLKENQKGSASLNWKTRNIYNWTFNMFQVLMKWLSYWYLQYELITCIYMFEPWEKKLLNSIIIMLLSLVSYSSYMYLPHYTMSLLSELKILPMDSIRSESTDPSN